MNDNLLINYASALFEVALEKNIVEETKSQLKELRDLFDEEIELVNFLDSAFVSEEKKHEVLDKLFKDQINLLLLNYLKLITDKGIIKDIHKLYREFKHAYNRHFRIYEGIIYTPFEIDEEKISRICSVFEEKLKHRIDLRVYLEPRLLGGIKVVIKDKVYDYSILNKIESVKDKLVYKKD